MQHKLGRHVIADFWGGKSIGDPKYLEAALKNAAIAAGANILNTHVHHFGEGQGVTAVIALSESHITIHTWPEHGYSAIDVFMCGAADPHVAISSLRTSIGPSESKVIEHPRGQFTSISIPQVAQ
jgi:S-adenosylmethionine decarboxylase